MQQCNWLHGYAIPA